MAASFSIVLPVHDSPIEHLESQLRAITAQRADFECIVVDDGSSTDEPARLVERFAADDPRIRLIRRPTNGGIAAATNDGIDAASKDWVVFCDHDDLLAADALSAIDEHISRHPEVAAIYTDERLVDEHGETVAEYAKPDWSPIRQLGHHYLAHVSAVRRSALGDLRVRAEFEPSQDYDLWLRLVERLGAHEPGGEAAVGHVARPLYDWRAIDGSSALAASEKPAMCEAVRRCVAGAVERRSLAATAVTVASAAGPTTAVRLDWHERPDPTEITVVEVDPSWTGERLATAVEGATTRLVALAPSDVGAIDPGVWCDLAAEVAGRGEVVAAGPRVADAAGNLLSNGRTIDEGLSDPHEGYAVDDGPWGADLVVREASALSPVGLVVERAAFLSIRGSGRDDDTLDVAVARFCRSADVDGRRVVLAPQHVVTVADRDGWRLDGRHRLAHRRAWADVVAHLTAGGATGALVERHAVEGRRSGSMRIPTVYDEAVATVDGGDIDLVTCDVFDTLVTRAAARPSHLFVTLGERMLAAGLVDPARTALQIATARETAERRARRAYVRSVRVTAGEGTAAEVPPECTLDEIWEILGPQLGCDPAAGIGAELDHEAERLTTIPEGVALIERINEADVPVVLVSDSYLSADQLGRLLDRVGVPIDLLADVVTSSDRRRGKAHGLIAEVVADRGVDPERVLHVGDHPVADVAAAREIGASTCHVDLPDAERHVDVIAPAMAWWSSRTGTDLEVSSVVRRTLLTAQFGRHPAYQLGAAGLGPAMFGFARWIDATTRSLDSDAAHFLLREGATIADLVGLATPAGGISRRLVHASRWVDVRATIVEGRHEEIRAALDRRSPITVDHVADAFDLDHERVRSTIGSAPIHPAHFDELAHVLADDDDLRSGIVAASAALRARVLGLLERELDLSGSTVVLVDVGWGGRIHEAIERILRSGGHDHHVVGLFFALSDSGAERVSAGADIRSYLPNSLDDLAAIGDPLAARRAHALAHQPDVIERTLMPPTATFVDVADDGSPVLATRTEARHPSTATTQRGVRDVVRALATLPPDDRWVTDMAWRGALASAVHDAATRPRQPVARIVREWSHDDVGGTDVTALDRGGRGVDDVLVASSTARDIEALHTGAATWIDLAAAAENPATAAQRWAVADGLDLDLIAPRHPGGVSTLSVFVDGDDEPALQQLVELGSTVDGWTAIRVDGEVASPRAIRFDPGREPMLVELGSMSIEVRQGAEIRSVEIDGCTDPRLRTSGVHVVDATRFASAPDGHLLVPITDTEPFESFDRAAPSSISVAVRFRRWTIDPTDDVLTPSPLDRAGDAASTLARRGRRLATRLRGISDR